MHAANHILLPVSHSYRKQLKILLTVGKHHSTPNLHCMSIMTQILQEKYLKIQIRFVKGKKKKKACEGQKVVWESFNDRCFFSLFTGNCRQIMGLYLAQCPNFPTRLQKLSDRTPALSLLQNCLVQNYHWKTLTLCPNGRVPTSLRYMNGGVFFCLTLGKLMH